MLFRSAVFRTEDTLAEGAKDIVEGKKRTGELREQAEQRAYNTALAENIGKKQEIKVTEYDKKGKITSVKTYPLHYVEAETIEVAPKEEKQ